VWCHNPETQKIESELLFYSLKCIGCGECLICQNNTHVFEPSHRVLREKCVTCGKCVAACPTNALELVGEEFSPEQLLEQVLKDRAFYCNDGGVTVSGGEAFMQGESVIEFLSLVKQNNISTVVETCGFFREQLVEKAVEVVDLFLWDIKDTDPERHKANTGVFPDLILKNLFAVDSLGGKTRLRLILVQGVNTNPEHYAAVVEIFKKLTHCEGIELIPCHTFGSAKATALDKLAIDDKFIPSNESIQSAKEFFEQNSVPLF
jgi:pyruvate formate lyase activating enzyme